MVIFLYGRDSYRLKQNQDNIVSEYKKKHAPGMNFVLLDLADSGELSRLKDSMKMKSFFSNKSLIVVRNAFSEGSETARLVKEYDLANDKDRLVVFAENASEAELSKNNKELFKILNGDGNMAKSFEPLNGIKLEHWLVKEIRGAGCEIDKKALSMLMDYTIDPNHKDPDEMLTWRLKQETDKLISYKLNSPGRIIVTQDVELLVAPRIDLNIFQVLDAVASKNKPRALSLLHHHLEENMDPHYIFSMLVYLFRNMLRVKSLVHNAVPYPEIIKRTALNPFVVKKTHEQCKKYDLDELKGLYNLLAETDINAKTGQIDMADGLYGFVLAIRAH